MTKKLNDEQRAEQRIKVAQELATKDGADFESLDEIMKSAYLHNADCAIADREAKPTPAGPPPEVYTCAICKDEGFVGGKPCLECNPVGLQREETKQEEPAPAPAPAPVLKKGQYFCLKCRKPHVEDKKLGKRHLKYKEA